MIREKLSDVQYGLLFDVRRSVRYHDRRRAFYEQLHNITSLLTILMAGSVLFDVAKSGSTATWMVALSVIAGLLAALDMVLGYSRRANLHSDLRARFADLEIEMLQETDFENDWLKYQHKRLLIEKDEPPIYVALDALCRNELLVAEGFSKAKDADQFAKVGRWQRLTRQLCRWENWEPV